MNEPMCLSGSISSPGCKSDYLKREIRELERRVENLRIEMKSWKNACHVEHGLSLEFKQQAEKLTKSLEIATTFLRTHADAINHVLASDDDGPFGNHVGEVLSAIEGES